MAYRVENYAPCIDCGRKTNRRHNRSRVPMCLECSTKRMARHNIETATAAQMRRSADWSRYHLR